MSCILRAMGAAFDIDGFMGTSSALVVGSFWRKGEPVFIHPNSTRNTHQSSGIRVVVSQASFSMLSQQIEDAIAFFLQHKEAIHRLASFSGVDKIVLDFAAEIHPPGWCSFVFPAELLSLVGAVGVSLCVSTYPNDTERN